MEVLMTAETLSLLAGTILSLLFSYVPGLNTKFASFDTEKKRGIMLVILAVCAGAIYGLSCAGWATNLHINVTCDQAGAWILIQAFILAVIANQGIYSISPDTNAVKRIWAEKSKETV